MMSKLKTYFQSLVVEADQAYYKLFQQQLSQAASKATANGTKIKLLDVGCYDGSNTLKLVAGVKNLELHGIELVPEFVEEAKKNGIEAVVGSANEPFPCSDASFDVVMANQLIEHLTKQDAFLDEVYRVLKPGGLFLVCTPNLASWHNVVALFMGWQPFPMTIYSEKRVGIGNPIKLHRGEDVQHPGMLHTRVYTLRALKELLELHNFEITMAAGSGYYPFPTRAANFMSKRDPNHTVIQFIEAVKPLKS